MEWDVETLQKLATTPTQKGCQTTICLIAGIITRQHEPGWENMRNRPSTQEYNTVYGIINSNVVITDRE